jgi:4-hydroxy-tetrahydrodipicolinate synthase
MSKGKYYGVITPLITPFKENGEIDYDALEELLNFLLTSKVNGFFVNATTGEFTSLSLKEKKEVAIFVSSKVGNKAKVLINVASTDMREVIELCKFAQNIKVDGIVSPPPYFLIPDKNGLKSYFLQIAKESNLDTFIYNIPAATGYSIHSSLVQELAESDERIIGVKATIDNLSYLKEIVINIKEKRPEFSAFTGVEYYFLPNLLSHGDGGIVALSNFAPLFFTSILDAFEQKNLDRLMLLQYKIMELSQIYSYASSFASSIKISLQLLGFKTTKFVRRPLSTDSEETVNKIKQILFKTGILKGV